MMTSQIRFRSGIFTISFPGSGASLELKHGPSIGITVEELQELRDLAIVALETTGNDKREWIPHSGGNPTQIDEDVNAQLTT